MYWCVCVYVCMYACVCVCARMRVDSVFVYFSLILNRRGIGPMKLLTLQSDVCNSRISRYAAPIKFPATVAEVVCHSRTSGAALSFSPIHKSFSVRPPIAAGWSLGKSREGFTAQVLIERRCSVSKDSLNVANWQNTPGAVFYPRFM